MRSAVKLRHSLIAVLASLLLQGCTIASHETKNKYWAMQPDIHKLPPINVVAKSEYISYPLLFSKKGLFESVASCSGVYPAEVEITFSGGPADNIALALSWLMVSGSTGFIIPYKASNPRYAEFTVKIHGENIKTFKYEDRKSIWIASLGMFSGGLTQENDEYYVEELMADQFVNSFIIDLRKDDELMGKLQTTSQ